MQYVCVHCDVTFEPDAADKPRCPKCMRVHGVRAVGGAAPAAGAGKPRGSRRALIALAAAVCVATAAFFALRAGRGLGGEAGVQGTLFSGNLGQALAARGVAAGKLSELLVPDAAIERFAAQAAAGRSSAVEQARGVMAALRARAGKQAFVPWSMADARETAPMTASAVLAAIGKDDARLELYPLEVAALGVAALRTLQVPATLCEVFTLGAERAPLDPSGRLGYFVIALPEGKPGERRYFDAYGGRPEQTTCDDCAVLSDLEAVGAALGISALQRIANNEDPAAALRDADAAIKLLPTSPSVRSARGAVLLSNAATEPGQQEFEAAAQLRSDPPRHHNLAMLALANGDGERAARELSQALQAQPDFALARVTLAALHLAQGEREQARAELDKAEALDPRLPALVLTRSQYYASTGEMDQAIAQAERAVALRSRDPQPHLLLGRIYRQQSRFDDMRREARAVLALGPETQKTRLRELIEKLLGATALESEVGAQEPQAAPSEAPRPAPTAPEPDPSIQLHLGDKTLPTPGTLNPAEGPSTLRLQQPGGKLKLDLGH